MNGSQCHLILELYASGNLVLTDHTYNVLSLLRSHRDDQSLPDAKFSTAGWAVEGGQGAFSQFRIRQTGKNSDGGGSLCCAGIELYGVLHTPQR